MASINTNISAYYAQNNLRTAANQAQASIARLSSGNKIVSASDDVAGLSIGTILRTTVSTLKTASTNAGQGTTLLQVADGALSSLGEILQRQKALAVQANSGTLSDNERGYLNQEFQALKSEYDRIVNTTNFNNVNLLDGSLASSGGLLSAGPATNNSYGAKTSATAMTAMTGGINSSGFVASAFSTTTSTSNSFQGSLKDAIVTATYAASSSIGLTININGVSYTSDALVTTSAAAATTGFTATDGSGQKFQLSLTALNTPAGATITTQALAQKAADALQVDLRTVTIYQDRSIDTTVIPASKTANTALAGLTGASFVVRGDEFGAVAGSTKTANLPTIGAFQVTSNTATNATFSIVINGHTYSNKNVTVSATSKALDMGAGGTNGIRLTSVDDSSSYFDIKTNSLTGDVDLSSQAAANNFQDAINKVLGSSTFGGLSFQVGTDSADTIGISVASVGSDNVYKDSSGVAQTLDIGTQAGAITASDVLDIAIKSVTATRADVGALQSRFGYASATLNTSIQNLDAARGQFLDTDVSAESTKFATQQVLQQAAISVLAQANQIPQNLLKLIG